MTTTTPDRAGTGDETVIDVSGLRMSYGAFEAVRGIDLYVARGEVFAFLGPNGAGETTAGEDLGGLRPAHGGPRHCPRPEPPPRRAVVAGPHRGGLAGV